MKDIIFEVSTREEYNLIDDRIIKYNSSKVLFTQDPAFIPINRVIKDASGDIVAGINSILYSWNCLFIDVLWVKEELRVKGYGSVLLNETERIAKEKGCKLIHLDTFGFQSKDFYIKHGYDIFGILENCSAEHKRYYMKKDL